MYSCGADGAIKKMSASSLSQTTNVNDIVSKANGELFASFKFPKRTSISCQPVSPYLIAIGNGDGSVEIYDRHWVLRRYLLFFLVSYF